MKPPDPIFEGDIVDGKLILLPNVRKSISRWLSTFKPGSHVEIIIRKYRTDRTKKQNKYYWGVVIPILADHFGYDNPEDLHSDLKREFNPIESKIHPGEIIGGTTTKLSTIEFMASDSSYVERICRWAASEYGIFIPAPEKAE